MDTANLLIALLALIAGALLAWFIAKNRNQTESKDDKAMLLLQQQMAELTKQIDAKLGESRRDIDEKMRFQFSQSQKLVNDISDKLMNVTKVQTEAQEATQQMLAMAKELQSLQDILKNPKQRGVLGEYYLEALLKNILPAGGYKMQYEVGQDENGNKLIVDAAVFVKDKIIPVDSKFSLENYNRFIEAKDVSEKERLEKSFTNDLKNRIIETSKYIRPSEGTMDFAFMFIPHEAIYYDLLVNKVGSQGEENENLIQRAAGKHRVIIVSPTSFLAYLQTVLQGLRAMQIEEHAKEIRKKADDLGRHLKAYEEAYLSIGKNLSTVVNKYNETGQNWKLIDKDITRITGDAPGLEVAALEKPKVEV